MNYIDVEGVLARCAVYAKIGVVYVVLDNAVCKSMQLSQPHWQLVCKISDFSPFLCDAPYLHWKIHRER